MKAKYDRCSSSLLFALAALPHCTTGSMGAAQSYQWATQYPDMVETIAPFCGSAR